MLERAAGNSNGEAQAGIFASRTRHSERAQAISQRDLSDIKREILCYPFQSRESFRYRLQWQLADISLVREVALQLTAMKRMLPRSIMERPIARRDAERLGSLSLS